ncbi:MAG: nuclear transport factor 2 family protein [Candidatus Hydrogenedentes bacterium]|nr:nuclear transport factor 2 family protein [Candidatus Hydrogenedentota bacterium]
MPEPIDTSALERNRILDYMQQCDGLSRDWRQLRELVSSYPGEDGDRKQHDMQLVYVKGRISCDYPIVQAWRSGEYAIGSDIHAVVADLSDLQEMAARRNGAAQVFSARWDRVNGRLSAAQKVLSDTHEKLERGVPVQVPETFRYTTRRIVIPWKKIFKYGAVAATVTILAGTAWVLRNFLGVGAPGEGDGIAFAIDMPPREQVELCLKTMSEAMEADNLDRFMTIFADDFTVPDGSGKRELRALLQTARTAGEFARSRVDISEAQFNYLDEGIRVSPLKTTGEDFSMTFYLLFSLRNGKYLAVAGDEL